VIDARTTDKAAIEIIGSKNIQIENLEIVGHATSTPAIGIWTGRSSVSIDVARFNFRNVDFTGSFTLACWLVTGAESHHWENCSTYITNAGCDAGILFDYRNALSGITPDNATLNLTYDTAICWINNSFITCANTATAFMPIYVYAGAAPTIRDTYLVAYGAPIIYARGGCTGLMLDNVAVEGTPTYLLHITSDATYNVSSKVSDFKLENISLPSSICSSGYSVYAEDTTVVRNSNISECGLIDDLRLYDVEGCDFSRWGHYLSGGDFITTLTIANGSSNTRIYKNIDDIVVFGGSVSYNTTVFDDGIAAVSTGTRFYIAPKVLTVTETWDPGSLADGAAATTYIQVIGVTAAAYVALASFPSIVTTGWDISAYPTDGYVVVTITNRTGDTVDLASGTLRVVAMKVV
jgi:hypothetical protein